MKWVAHISEGLQNLYFAKLRSILALIGVLVGSASVVAMVLGGELAREEALKQFKTLGTDLLAVNIHAANDEKNHYGGKAQALVLNDALNIIRADKKIRKAAPYTELFSPVYYAGKPLNGMILGVTDSFADIGNIKLKSGRFISTLDKYAFYCVIGADIYQAMKQISFIEPLGQQLQIGKNIFVIVGVADTWPENSFVYANINNAILIPLLATTVLSSYATINNILLRLTEKADISSVQDQIKSYLKRHVSEHQVYFRSAKELIIKMEKQSNILTVFLGLIGGISLFVGGIGVMNIMLVSVMERRREIGIRLAVGAKRRDIAALFLIESIMLSLVGGSLGVILGITIAYFIAWFWDWTFNLFWLPPFVGFSVSTGVGIFFGFYPAYLASKLDPIDALRAE